MSRRPWIADRKVAAALGVVLFVVACLLLYDAYERRGGRSPLLIRLFTPT